MNKNMEKAMNLLIKIKGKKIKRNTSLYSTIIKDGKVDEEIYDQ